MEGMAGAPCGFTSGLVGVITWEGPWDPVFRKAAPLNFQFVLLTEDEGGVEPESTR